MEPSSLNLEGVLLDGKYRMAALLGQGGMGAVYSAEHVGTGRRVAVKVVLSHLLANEEALERFRREARAAGGIRHPNVVDVTDFGVCRLQGVDLAYLIMEHLEGATLRAVLDERGVLAVETVVAVVGQVALALDAAHRQGIVHRDLKPENIWLIPDPRGGHIVRVLDFGIAKLQGARSTPLTSAVSVRDANTSTTATAFVPRDRRATLDTLAEGLRSPDAGTVAPSARGSSTNIAGALTVAGDTLGTPAYMSPEQCRGDDVDARSDIYSLGVITYEAFAGRRPFSGSFTELVAKHLSEDPQPLARVAGIPTRISSVVARALAKSPDDRYPSARAMAGSLYAAAERPSVIVRRSIALYSDEFPTFFRLSRRAAAIGLLVLMPFVAASIAFRGIAPPLMGLGGMLAWGAITLRSNAFFASAIDAMRRRPLDRIDVDNVEKDVRKRLGISERASALSFLARLAFFYTRAELRSQAGAGDLAFLIMFLEGLTIEQVPERCRLLATSVRQSYKWIGALLFAALLVPPFLEGAVVDVICHAARITQAAPIAMTFAFVAIPFNAMFFNPVFSSALAILYFRARQAVGEDVALTSVVPARL